MSSLLLEFLGDYPQTRVLDFLIENNIFDYPKKEICKEADVSWNTLETFWDKLTSNEIIVKTRVIGRASMYKLNLSNTNVQKLLELDNGLMKESMRKIKTKERQPAFA